MPPPPPGPPPPAPQQPAARPAVGAIQDEFPEEHAAYVIFTSQADDKRSRRRQHQEVNAVTSSAPEFMHWPADCRSRTRPGDFRTRPEDYCSRSRDYIDTTAVGQLQLFTS